MENDPSYRWHRFYWLPQGNVGQIAKYAGLILIISLISSSILEGMAYSITNFWLFMFISTIAEILNVGVAYAILLFITIPLIYIRNKIQTRHPGENL